MVMINLNRIQLYFLCLLFNNWFETEESLLKVEPNLLLLILALNEEVCVPKCTCDSFRIKFDLNKMDCFTWILFWLKIKSTYVLIGSTQLFKCKIKLHFPIISLLYDKAEITYHSVKTKRYYKVRLIQTLNISSWLLDLFRNQFKN